MNVYMGELESKTETTILCALLIEKYSPGFAVVNRHTAPPYSLKLWFLPMYRVTIAIRLSQS